MNFEEFVKRVGDYEGFRGVRYLDPVGIPTIGFGFTKSVFQDKQVPETMSREYAEELLGSHLRNILINVTDYSVSKGYDFSYDQRLALTDFTYNCGSGNLEKLTKNGTRTPEQIADSIRLYNKAGGKVLAGLTKRRQWEYELFTNTTPFNNVKEPTAKDIQTLLNDKYGYRLEVDGKIGKLTLTAIYNSLLK